jgi:hypothetical protein
MADIWLILRGQPDLQAMSAMSLPELMDWHHLAIERALKKEK